MNFHARAAPDRPLPLPAMLGHFLPWYTIHGDHFPLPPDEAAELDPMPAIEDLRHWRDAGSGYRRSHHHLPAIGRYDSRSPAVIEWQIETALFHGFAGFILNWYGKHSVENVITLHVLRAMERWNAANPDRRIVYFLSLDSQMQLATEGKTPVPLEEDFRYIRSRLLRDAYLCRDGKPVFSIFPYEDNAPAWRAAADAVFGKDGVDLIWMNGSRPDADACYSWVRPDEAAVNAPGPYTWTDPDNAGDGWLRAFHAAANASNPKPEYLMAGVWPGFNDHLVAWAWNPGKPDHRPRVIARNTTRGNTLELTWKEYLDYLQSGATVPAPLVQVVTWNDYAETTTVEPTLDYGTGPLDICARGIREARALWRAPAPIT